MASSCFFDVKNTAVFIRLNAALDQTPLLNKRRILKQKY